MEEVGYAEMVQQAWSTGTKDIWMWINGLGKLSLQMTVVGSSRKVQMITHTLVEAEISAGCIETKVLNNCKSDGWVGWNEGGVWLARICDVWDELENL